MKLIQSLSTAGNVLRQKSLATVMVLGLTSLAVVAAPATRVANALWANGATYGTVLTDTSFNAPPAHSTDALYNFAMSGLEGQRAIAAAAPGDRDYNGGRWHVYLVIFTDQGLAIHDPTGDGTVDFELTSEEAVWHHESLGHLIIMPTDIYFECPLLRSR